MKSEAIQEHTRDLEAQGAAANEVHLLDLLILLSKRRKFIFWFTFGVAVLTAIIVLVVPSKFTATTVVLPPGQNSSMSSALLSQLGGSSALASAAGAGLGIKNPGDMYVSLFRSRTIEDALIQRFGLMARYKVKKITDARRAFEDRSTVTLGVKDGLIRITVTDFDPNLAAEIANAYVDEFRKLSANLAITEASQRRIFFQQQLLEANQNLTAAEVALKNTEQSTGVLQPDSQARSLIESGAILRGQVVAKEVELQAMRSYATEDNPQMVVAEQQLTALKAQLAKLGATDENLSSDIIVPKGNIPQAGMEYIRKLRDEKYYETIFELIAKQLEMAKLDEARQGAIVQVADVAVPPDKKSSPQRTLIVVLMTLIAFVIAVLWTLSSEQWHRMQRDPDTYDKVQTLRQLFSKKQRLQA
ncbi:MAG: Wzz/FepE/Etk N-terminal domain-containing protein [Terracidiphilus sp.]|jgi:capsule polysaccharide export protein KpsE/RkpR